MSISLQKARETLVRAVERQLEIEREAELCRARSGGQNPQVVKYEKLKEYFDTKITDMQKGVSIRFCLSSDLMDEELRSYFEKSLEMEDPNIWTLTHKSDV